MADENSNQNPFGLSLLPEQLKAPVLNTRGTEMTLTEPKLDVRGINQKGLTNNLGAINQKSKIPPNSDNVNSKSFWSWILEPSPDSFNERLKRQNELQKSRDYRPTPPTLQSQILDQAAAKIVKLPEVLTYLSIGVPLTVLIAFVGYCVISYLITNFSAQMGLSSGPIPGFRLIMKYDLHHIFPRQFRDIFLKYGIEIDEYAVKITRILHRQIHPLWNQLWQQWILERLEKGEGFTFDEALKFGIKLLRLMDIYGADFEPYLRSR